MVLSIQDYGLLGILCRIAQKPLDKCYVCIFGCCSTASFPGCCLRCTIGDEPYFFQLLWWNGTWSMQKLMLTAQHLQLVLPPIVTQPVQYMWHQLCDDRNLLLLLFRDFKNIKYACKYALPNILLCWKASKISLFNWNSSIFSHSYVHYFRHFWGWLTYLIVKVRKLLTQVHVMHTECVGCAGFTIQLPYLRFITNAI